MSADGLSKVSYFVVFILAFNKLLHKPHRQGSPGGYPTAGGREGLLPNTTAGSHFP